MKQLFYILLISVIAYSCGNSKNTTSKRQLSEEEAVVISNDSLEYEIIILDLGFNTYLNSIARPANFYSQEYYEIKNIFYVTEWNIRHDNPTRYGGFYETRIDYQQSIDYGLDVNYKLYNYFKFCEYKYGIRFRSTR
ncbi:DUF6146 family protein [Urechidicola vernalis]|uniref:DUF6146 family protein n=1 Tax=Urechidicola vernalis TaxID=3075600 RepID=A0ABU2Y5P4_9FLAO|nr:DUF6146 family protein [Urechidicola sp. P050]MDT0553521.1 DUF6146 family protein [Urechidicola sp. P050]